MVGACGCTQQGRKEQREKKGEKRREKREEKKRKERREKRKEKRKGEDNRQVGSTLGRELAVNNNGVVAGSQAAPLVAEELLKVGPHGQVDGVPDVTTRELVVVARIHHQHLVHALHSPGEHLHQLGGRNGWALSRQHFVRSGSGHSQPIVQDDRRQENTRRDTQEKQRQKKAHEALLSGTHEERETR